MNNIGLYIILHVCHWDLSVVHERLESKCKPRMNVASCVQHAHGSTLHRVYLPAG